ncbi:MAG: HU family DNA-binding protein [Bacteroidales bacterium]|nr:HU family DNA-binding protein [Bacteroidales bacterium]
MNNKELIVALAEELSITQKDVTAMLNAYVGELQQALTVEQPVAFLNAGSFEVKTREQRLSVNPKSKRRMLVPPKMVLNFVPTSTLKNKIKKQDSNE